MFIFRMSMILLGGPGYACLVWIFVCFLDQLLSDLLAPELGMYLWFILAPYSAITVIVLTLQMFFFFFFSDLINLTIHSKEIESGTAMISVRHCQVLEQEDRIDSASSFFKK